MGLKGRRVLGGSCGSETSFNVLLQCKRNPQKGLVERKDWEKKILWRRVQENSTLFMPFLGVVRLQRRDDRVLGKKKN